GTSTSLRSSISGLGRGRHLEQRRVAGAGAAAQLALATAFGRGRGLLGRLLAGDGLVLGLLLVAPAEALAAQADLAVGGISRRRCLAGGRGGRRALRNCPPAENARRPIRPVDHATAPGVHQASRERPGSPSRCAAATPLGRGARLQAAE